MDLILNSLAGEAMLRSLELVAPFGRFVEIGKRDQLEGTRVDLREFAEGAAYCSAHVDVLMRNPTKFRKLMKEVWGAVDAGVIKPLPTTVFEGLSSAGAALRFLGSGKHIGKVLCTVAEPAPTIPPSIAPSDSPLVLTAARPDDSGLARAVAQEWCDAELAAGRACSIGPGGLCIAATEEAARAHRAEVCLVPAGESWDTAGAVTVRLASPSGGTVAGPHGLRAAVAAVAGAAEGVLAIPRGRLAKEVAKAARWALGSGRQEVVVTRFNWGAGRGSPAAGRVAQWQAVRDAAVKPIDQDSRSGESAEEISEAVQKQVATTLGQPSVPTEATLTELGFDSLGLLQLAHALRKRFPAAGLTAGDVTEDTRVSQLCARVSEGARPGGQDGLVSVGQGPKVLCLHGFRTSAEILLQQLSATELSKQAGVTLVAVDAPHLPSGPADPALGGAQLGQLFEWWGCPAEAGADGQIPYLTGWRGEQCKGLAESVAKLEAVVEKHGPFAGVVGFSQGAAMGQMLVAAGKVSFGVFFSAVTCHAPEHKDTFASQYTTPSVHIWDPVNDESQEEAAKLAECFATGEKHHHGLGHVVPSLSTDSSTYRAAADFVKRLARD